MGERKGDASLLRKCVGRTVPNGDRGWWGRTERSFRGFVKKSQ